MKTVSLSGSPRVSVGKKGATSLRNEGRIPSVVYGGKDQIHFSILENEAKKLVFTPNVYLIELDIDGKKSKVILQETQIHPVTDRILHLDFLEIFDDAPFKLSLPVRLEGFSRGVRNGGKLTQNFRKLRVFGLAKDMPDAVSIDISPIKIGDKVRVTDLNVSGLNFLDPKNAVVVGVQTARVIIEEEEEEEDTETTEGEESKGDSDDKVSDETKKDE
ncbi:50S ribosomal protein L25/general stress protein Ctc [Bacteroidota bacterium]|nr:50S ribosomal protein L25/general stress protein Ctc [Crocinitomicaceae bacterium]MDC3134202.1 50S ribosomal protein L25/general stress protein Ctc [Bacteroidota bacterium]